MIYKLNSPLCVPKSLAERFGFQVAFLFTAITMSLSTTVLATGNDYFPGLQVSESRAVKSVPMPEHDAARQAMQHGQVMPYYDLKKKVEKKIDAKIIGEKLRHTNRGWVYDLRVQRRRGKVSSVIVDAQTAEIYVMK